MACVRVVITGDELSTPAMVENIKGPYQIQALCSESGGDLRNAIENFYEAGSSAS